MKDRYSCFQFKASFSPCTIMQITRYDLEALEKNSMPRSNKRLIFLIAGGIDLEGVKLGALDFRS